MVEKLSEKNSKKKIHIGNFPEETAQSFRKKTSLGVRDLNFVLKTNTKQKTIMMKFSIKYLTDFFLQSSKKSFCECPLC